MTSNRKMSPITWPILTLMGFYAGNIVSRPVRVSYMASHDVPAAINASLEAYKNPGPQYEPHGPHRRRRHGSHRALGLALPLQRATHHKRR